MRELEVTPSDAKRLLSQEKFELLQVCAEAQKTTGILPSLLPYYRRTIDELKQLKFEEITRNKFEEYEHSLTIDEKRLTRTVNHTSLTTRQEACQFVQKHYPKFKKLLDAFDTINWIPQDLSKIISATKELSETTFEYGLIEVAEHPDAFMYKVKSWIFIIPHINFLKINGLNSLEFNLQPYAVFTLAIHRTEHKKIINGINRTFPASDKFLIYHTEILDNDILEINIPHIIIPWKLIQGLAQGKIQTDGCEVILNKNQVVTYKIEGYENDVVLSHDFLNARA